MAEEEVPDFDALLFKANILMGEILEDQRIRFHKVHDDIVKLKTGYLLFNKKWAGKGKPMENCGQILGEALKRTMQLANKLYAHENFLSVLVPPSTASILKLRFTIDKIRGQSNGSHSHAYSLEDMLENLSNFEVQATRHSYIKSRIEIIQNGGTQGNFPKWRVFAGANVSLFPAGPHKPPVDKGKTIVGGSSTHTTPSSTHK
ncbi:OLC1v1038811C2 [Oldenlandia corymbosa var. corymbosa]|nr:OLC1v1038811C2 [Oldenlandia corymbosa var. corymbosa]